MVPLRKFALQATKKLRDEVRDARSIGAIGFCMALVSNLDAAVLWLESVPDTSRIGELLYHLDGLIHVLLNWRLGYVPRPTSLSSDPNLHNQFSGLGRLLTGNKWGKENIKSYSNSRREAKKRDELLQALAVFKAPQITDPAFDLPQSTEPSRKLLVESYEHTAEIQILYTYLSEIRCQETKTRIMARIRLRSDISSDHSNKEIGHETPIADEKNDEQNVYAGDEELHKKSPGRSFRIFFLDHPHTISPTASNTHRWQDSMICVAGKQVRFQDEQHVEQRASPPILQSPLCEMIRKTSSGIQIQLNLTEEGLTKTKIVSSAYQGSLLKQPTYISLDEILSQKRLKKRKTRLLLCFFLARAFWYFYGSGWMKKRWTKKDILFVFDPKSTTPTGIYFHEPYLSSFYPDADPATPNADTAGVNGTSKSSPEEFFLHQFPDILALGVMLTEIDLGLKIEDYDPDCYDEHGQLNINTAYLTAETIYKEKTELWDDSESFDGVKSVIAHCLALHKNGDPFLKFQGNKFKAELRDAIYEHIVGRLQKQCIDTYWSEQPDPDTWEVPVHPIGGYEESWQPPSSNSTMAPSDSGQTRSANGASSSSSDHWFTKLNESMTSVLRIKDSERDIYAPRVKIAILDTGLNPKFTEALRKAHRIEDYHDFVEPEATSLKDATGHGTSIFLLMKKVCDAAEFYIGRVWKNNRMSTNTPALVAKAINHARVTWAVDIIVLSSGFEDSYDEIESAIDDANREGILTYAAASNHGNITQISFPGRLYGLGKVLCVFSTDSMVKSSLKYTFNPSPLQGALHRSFAILGEDIVLENVNGTLCGTSFSTAVAAAVSACILDFSRHPDNRSLIERPAKLKRVESMLAVFGKMATLDNDYWCIAPWRICETTFIEDEDRTETIRRKRIEACNQIRDALKNSHKA